MLADVLRVRRLSTSNRTFGLDPPIGVGEGSNFPASGGRWNQAMAQVTLSRNDTPGPSNTPTARFAQQLNGGMMLGNLYAPNYANRDANQEHTSQMTSNSLFGGAHVTPRLQQPSVEVELPFYEPTRFEFVDNYLQNTTAKAAHEVSAVLTREKNTLGLVQPGGTLPVHDASKRSFVSRWVAPGEDFQCFYLLNAPVFFNNSQFILADDAGDLLRLDAVILAQLNQFPNISNIATNAYPYSNFINQDEISPTPL